MKKFLINVSIFAVLALLLCLGIEFFLLTVSNEYSYKRKYVEQHGDDIKVLILGHSHAGNGIDPAFLGDSAFNMAISGRNHYYDAILAERYIPHLKNLKCVIWSLGYNFQYSSFRYPCAYQKENEVNYVTTYKCMYEKYMSIHWDGSSIPYRYWSEIINSKLNYSTRAFKKDFEERNQCTPLGFERLKISAKKPITWTMEKLPLVVDRESKNTPLALAEAMSNFKRMASVCKDNGVRFIVVTLPCYRSFLDLTTERGIKEMYNCVDTMRSVNPAVEYYNYIDDTRFTEDDFYNSSHLTEVGARKFTEILRHDVLISSQ